MARRKRATDANVVSFLNGDNSFVVFALGVLLGYLLARR